MFGEISFTIDSHSKQNLDLISVLKSIDEDLNSLQTNNIYFLLPY